MEDWIEIQPYNMGRADGSLGGDRACPVCTIGSQEGSVLLFIEPPGIICCYVSNLIVF